MGLLGSTRPHLQMPPTVATDYTRARGTESISTLRPAQRAQRQEGALPGCG
jgi:hypothetical protein